jgi:hypothetical protein
MTQRYDVPGVGARIFNDVIRRLAERGISIQGSTAVPGPMVLGGQGTCRRPVAEVEP